MTELRAAYIGDVPMTELEQLNDTLDKLFELLADVSKLHFPVHDAS